MMHKCWFFGLSACLIPFSLLALPIGNPREASLQTTGVFLYPCCVDENGFCLDWLRGFSLRMGYYGDFVYDRHLQIDRTSDDAKLHDSEIMTHAAYFAINFCDRIDLFGTVGETQITLVGSTQSFGDIPSPFNSFATIQTDNRVSWSIGARASLWECRCFGLGAEVQYFHSRSRLNSFHREGFDTFYFPSNTYLNFDEWQLGVGATYRINIDMCSSALIPYLGVKWSRCKSRADGALIPPTIASPTLTVFDTESARDLGYAVGLTLLGCNKASITVEGRFRDEKALYVNGQFRF